MSFSLPSVPFVKLPCVPGDQISGDVEPGRSGRRRQKAGSPLPQDLCNWWGSGFFEGLWALRGHLCRAAPCHSSVWPSAWDGAMVSMVMPGSVSLLLEQKTQCTSSWESVPVREARTPGSLQVCTEPALSLLKQAALLGREEACLLLMQNVLLTASDRPQAHQILLNVTFNKSLHDFLKLIWINYKH